MNEKIKTWLREEVWENEQVVKLRLQFAELDTQTQSYVLLGAFGFFVTVLLGSLLFLMISTMSLKSRLTEMDAQIRFLQSSADKIEEQKAIARQQSFSPEFRDLDKNLPLSQFAEKVTQKSFIPKDNAEITEKGPEVSLALNKISLRQLVRTLYYFENSKSGIAVTSLSIDAKDDTEGYLWANLTVKKNLQKAGH